LALQTYWSEDLPYIINPRSGPMRRMETLRDVSDALQSDIPKGMLRQPEWLRVGLLLVQASESGNKGDVQIAADELVALIDKQGWMDRPRLSKGFVHKQTAQTSARAALVG
jgi:hypothetical protein